MCSSGCNCVCSSFKAGKEKRHTSNLVEALQCQRGKRVCVIFKNNSMKSSPKRALLTLKLFYYTLVWKCLNHTKHLRVKDKLFFNSVASQIN